LQAVDNRMPDQNDFNTEPVQITDNGVTEPVNHKHDKACERERARDKRKNKS